MFYISEVWHSVLKNPISLLKKNQNKKIKKNKQTKQNKRKQSLNTYFNQKKVHMTNDPL